MVVRAYHLYMDFGDGSVWLEDWHACPHSLLDLRSFFQRVPIGLDPLLGLKETHEDI